MKKFWIIGSIPFILIFVVTWIPQINGPHLWFGAPSIFVWVTVMSSIPVTGILIYFEHTRQDLDAKGDEV